MNIKRLLASLFAVCIAMTCCIAYAEGECEHPAIYVESYSRVFKAKEYGNITETTHTAYGDYVYVEYCYKCDTSFVEKVVETNATEVEEHWYSNGKCPACGYTNVCTHPEECIEIEVNMFDYTGEYGEITEHWHEAYGYNVVCYWCTACEESLEEKNYSELTSISENHYFENGECECGYKNTCEHPEEDICEVEYDYSSGVLIEITETTHTYEVPYEIVKMCESCGEFVERTYEQRIETEEHYFLGNELWDEDECYCGYIKGTKLPEASAKPAEPTAAPTAEPTKAPVTEPTAEPTEAPVTEPTSAPEATEVPVIDAEDDDVPKTGDRSVSYAVIIAMIALSSAVLAARRYARER